MSVLIHANRAAARKERCIEPPGLAALVGLVWPAELRVRVDNGQKDTPVNSFKLAESISEAPWGCLQSTSTRS